MTKAESNHGGFTKGLLVVLFIGAANADASLEQRGRIRDEVLPTLRETESPTEAMAEAVKLTAAIMGPSWRPTGEWDAWLMGLLEGS